MKKLYYKYFNKSVFDRFIQLNKKKNCRTKAMSEARKQLIEWDDIPIYMQRYNISRMLHVPKDFLITQNFMIRLIDGVPLKKMEKELKLEWFN